ncbi:MAG: thiolase family protein [Syntrophomonadaceae bacterium]|jgi:acetyl-CoA acetyltransferase
MDYKHLKNKYAIVGVGYTPQGKVPGRTALSFHLEACANAIKDAGLRKDDIDGLFIYRHFDPIGEDYDTTAFTVAEHLGIRPFALNQEYTCYRSWLTHAIGLLEAGFCKYIMVSYGDNARSGRRIITKELDVNNNPTDELAAFGDFSMLAKYAMIARRAMFEEGTGPHVWKEIALSQRAWANLNPIAGTYGKPLTEADYWNDPFVVEPFRSLDAVPNTDGGRAVIVTSAERARDLRNIPVLISGIGEANVPLSPFRHKNHDDKSAAAVASAKAFRMAGIEPDDVDACEIYDCFTFTVEHTLRECGFFKPGESVDWFKPERIGPGGSLPVNTSGGLLSEAYFMGLIPISEAVMQLRGSCGERQLGVVPGTKTPNIILCTDNGGILQSNCTIILERS